MSTGLVHFLEGGVASSSLRLQAAVLGEGLGLRLHADLGSLCSALDAASGLDTAPIVLVAGGHGLMCEAAHASRRFAARVKVVALLDDISEETLLQGLHSGVDACWPKAAPPALIVASLRRLAREPGCLSAAPEGTPGAHARWRLDSDGWAVQAGAVRIPLTAAERALVLALYRAPDNVLSHEELVRVLDAGRGKRNPHAGVEAAESPGVAVSSSAGTAARRLSVLMSRLRAKFEAAGTEMPVRSMRGTGYALSFAPTAARPHSGPDSG